ncbi:hypothetical protein D0Y65_021194 [Glycine soja]|nr:hypothetical protein D0Y65_021194 [Glycine soja]
MFPHHKMRALLLFWVVETCDGSKVKEEYSFLDAEDVKMVRVREKRSQLGLLADNWESIVHIMSSGCVGCYKRPSLSPTVDVPSKGLATQSNVVRKPSSSEDFWTTSTHDMDNSAVQSQGSISSASLTNQAVVSHAGSSKSSTNPTEFVNHGVILWNQTRQRWVGNKKPENQTQQLQEPKLSWNATYESLLGSNKPFRQPIPLAEMVDFLVDIWEQDGLYD